jgi:segregation and condensation protein A
MPDILEGVTPLRLQRAFVRSIMPKPPTSILLDHVAPIGVSVADALLELVETLPSMGRVTFRELTVAIRDRIHVVVRFLALLELFKQRRVDLEQTERFGDITVTWIGGDNVSFDPTFDIDDYEG